MNAPQPTAPTLCSAGSLASTRQAVRLAGLAMRSRGPLGEVSARPITAPEAVCDLRRRTDLLALLGSKAALRTQADVLQLSLRDFLAT